MLVREFLDEMGAEFRAIRHRRVVGSQRLAQQLTVPGGKVAKSVIIEADGQPVLVLVPASRRVDLDAARYYLDADRIELASEQMCQRLYRDCELGALPPFGSRHGMLTLMDRELAAQDEIVFEGNRHDEAIRMRVTDFREVENPMVVDIARRY